MHKLWLIIQREYLTRVQKRTFILTTLLTPVAFVFFMVVVGFIMSSGREKLRLVVKDDNRFYRYKTLADAEYIDFELDTVEELESLKRTYKEKGYDGVLYLPLFQAGTDFFLRQSSIDYQCLTDKSLGQASLDDVQGRLSDYLRDVKIALSGYDKAIVDKFSTRVSVREQNLHKTETASSVEGMLLGGVMGTLIYLVIFIYGSMVMRSVMEEKTSRIVEVMVSSVRPFQLMMGKIIGVGAVGLTQFLIWAVLLPLLYFFALLLVGGQLLEAQQNMSAPTEGLDPASVQAMAEELQEALGRINYPLRIAQFILFFLGGYVLYASLFAALGSAMGDDQNDSQALTLPVTLPVLLSFYIGISVLNNPNSSMALWASLFPLFSPIVMTARLGFDPPWWQVLLSLALLYTACVFFVWFSGRIYRIGVLMYGKKVTFKELWKWLWYRD
jgi:ABC-2 type transport system permease protein